MLKEIIRDVRVCIKEYTEVPAINGGTVLKKTLLISLPIVDVLLLAAGYFFGMPALQANGYKATAKQNQATLSASVDRAITAAKQNAFLQDDVTIAQAKNAVKISNDAASDLESKINSNEKGLTDFSELPWVTSVNSGYKTTLAVRSLEAEYVKAAKDYLAELKSVTKYDEQTIPILKLMEDVENMPSLDDAANLDEATAAIDNVIAKLNQVIKLADQMKPTESMKESHELNLKTANELVAIMKQMKTGIATLDAELLMTSLQAFQDKATSVQKKSKELEIDFVEKSKLTQLGDKLNSLSKQIDAKTSNW